MVFCYSSRNGLGCYHIKLLRIKGVNSSAVIRQNRNKYGHVSCYDYCVHGGTQGSDLELVRLLARWWISHSQEVRGLEPGAEEGQPAWPGRQGALRRGRRHPAGSQRGNEAVPFHALQLCQILTRPAPGVGRVEKRRCMHTAVGSIKESHRLEGDLPTWRHGLQSSYPLPREVGQKTSCDSAQTKTIHQSSPIPKAPKARRVFVTCLAAKPDLNWVD